MIEVKDLYKTFGPKVAVNGVSFKVERGEVLGFLGPNGAGKSTTMRMITGYTPPTSGNIRIAGKDMLEDPVPGQRLIGYLPENAPAYADMTVTGFLSFAAEIRGLSGQKKKDAIERAIETCFLQAVRHQSIDTLSKGYKHRTCFAQSIIHDPDILVLDEPTDGLDPNQKHEVRTLIRRMGEKKAIIFSTHILEEVEAVCSRAIIIDRGSVVANGTPEELKRRSARAGVVSLRIQGTEDGAKAKLEALPATKSVSRVSGGDGVVLFQVTPEPAVQPGDLAGAIFELASRERWKVRDLHTEEGRLDEVFRTITVGDAASRKDSKDNGKEKGAR